MLKVGRRKESLEHQENLWLKPLRSLSFRRSEATDTTIFRRLLLGQHAKSL